MSNDDNAIEPSAPTALQASIVCPFPKGSVNTNVSESRGPLQRRRGLKRIINEVSNIMSMHSVFLSRSANGPGYVPYEPPSHVALSPCLQGVSSSQHCLSYFLAALSIVNVGAPLRAVMENHGLSAETISPDLWETSVGSSTEKSNVHLQ